VITHEHADHISGFQQAHDILLGEAMTIRNLWLAWTEDPKDPDALRLNMRLQQAGDALTALDDRLDDNSVAKNLAAFGRPRNSAAILERLVNKAETVSYLSPHSLHEVPNQSSSQTAKLRAYVLGPPRDDKRLGKENPSKGAGKEVYLASTSQSEALEGAALMFGKMEDPASWVKADEAPFRGSYQGWPLLAKPPKSRSPTKWAGHGLPMGVQVPRGEQLSAHESAYFAAMDQRRIEQAWQHGANTLALRLDSGINNTSLVLAFELEDRQIALFPADAQVGNWLSWGDQKYPRTLGSAGDQTIQEILERVTLYKVGHHGSHNATLKELGLELMTDKRLVAMIPVDEALAAKQPSGWRMPDAPLYARLQEMTGIDAKTNKPIPVPRIVRGDGKSSLEWSKPNSKAHQVSVRTGPNGAILSYDLVMGG
jgi:hypothetical protein